MKQNRQTIDQIIAKLRQAGVDLGKGKKVPEGRRRTIAETRRRLGPDRVSERRACRVLG